MTGYMPKDYFPAFPMCVVSKFDRATGAPSEQDIYAGMSLRDWFAGQALAGLLADPDMNSDPEPVALVSYKYADAMLKARGL